MAVTDYPFCRIFTIWDPAQDELTFQVNATNQVQILSGWCLMSRHETVAKFWHAKLFQCNNILGVQTRNVSRNERVFYIRSIFYLFWTCISILWTHSNFFIGFCCSRPLLCLPDGDNTQLRKSNLVQATLKRCCNQRCNHQMLSFQKF